MLNQKKKLNIDMNLSPRITVHNVYAINNIKAVKEDSVVAFNKSKNYKNPWALPIVVFAIIVGVSAGSYGTWISKATQADLEQAQGSVLSVSTNEPWSKPMEFNVSDLNIVADMLPVLIEEARHVPTAEELVNAKRKADLKKYFEGRKSPFAGDETVEAFLNSKNMKLMIAISFVESTMGKRCYYNNCSGIGGYPPNLRKYESYAKWVKDFDSLLERRYKGMDPADMMGIYVQPGSPNWINGVRQILAELEKQGIE